MNNINKNKKTTKYTFKFGKFKDRELSEVDHYYLNFLLCTDWFTDKDILIKYIENLKDVEPMVLRFGKFKNCKINDELIENDYIEFLQVENIIHPVFFEVLISDDEVFVEPYHGKAKYYGISDDNWLLRD
jgi:hypothetical protein